MRSCLVSITPPRASGRCRIRIDVREILLDAVVDAIRRSVNGDADGIGEAEGIGAAVTLDADAVQSEEHRSIVDARIDARAHRAERRPDEQGAEPRQRRADQRAFSRWVYSRAVPSAVFSAIFPVKPSVTMTSTPPAMSSPSMKPWNADGERSAAGCRRLLYRVVALQVLGADVEQGRPTAPSSPSTLRAKTSPITANWTRLSAVALRDVGAQVEHHACGRAWSERTRRSPAGRHRQRLEHELRHRHQRAGVAGRDDTIGLTLRDRVDGRAHAGVLAVAQSDCRLGSVPMASGVCRNSTRERSRRNRSSSGRSRVNRPNSRNRSFFTRARADSAPRPPSPAHDRRPSRQWRW